MLARLWKFLSLVTRGLGGLFLVGWLLFALISISAVLYFGFDLLIEYPKEIAIIVAAIAVLSLFVLAMDYVQKRFGLSGLQFATVIVLLALAVIFGVNVASDLYERASARATGDVEWEQYLFFVVPMAALCLYLWRLSQKRGHKR